MGGDGWRGLWDKKERKGKKRNFFFLHNRLAQSLFKEYVMYICKYMGLLIVGFFALYIYMHVKYSIVHVSHIYISGFWV